MSILREYVKENHRIAESTAFMNAVFARKLPLNLWYDFQYQKSLFYKIIEDTASAGGYMSDIRDISRNFLLYQESAEQNFVYRKETIEYYLYIKNLPLGDRRILAHLYVWHMGDMYGGQMIKKVLGIDSPSLTFENREALIQKLENKLDIDLIDEANVAFVWAHKILQSYDSELAC